MHPSKMELIIMTPMRDQTDLRKEKTTYLTYQIII